MTFDPNPIRQIITGPVMNFQVLGRSSVGTVIPELPHITISITDPESPEAVLAEAENRIAYLRLQFDDADQPRNGFRLLSEDEAAQIVAFVEEHRAQIRLIVCHCEAGISRSAGVAAALSQWLNGDDQTFFTWFHPNRHVYRTVLNAALLREESTEKESTHDERT
jgi:predicted protein tyrosine phosphatase